MLWRFEIYQERAGCYGWRLKASNGQVVASSSKSFSTQRNAKAAALNVRKNAGIATVA
jgi:uncharacterized protein YegP (UPF0339 family)